MRLLAIACVAAWWAQSLPALTAPPTGAHAWRETDGLVVARNYCVEHAPFTEPRVDNRGATDGRTGTEFPALMWLSGKVGCATGDYVTVWRITSFAFALLLAVCLFLLARERFGEAAGPLAVLVFATSPLTPYFSRTTQPDMTAAALAATALLLASRNRLVPALACAALAALIKLPAAVYLPPVVFLAPNRRRALVLAAVALLPVGAWYLHARELELATGLTNFGVSRGAGQLLSEWGTRKFWQKSFVQYPFDVWVFPLATVALLGVLGWKRRATPPLVGVLGATVLAYVFLCGDSGAHHDYYGVVLLPALCLMIAWAASQLVALRRALVVLTALAAMAVGWQWSRARRWWPAHEPEWAALTAFSRAELGARGVVFSEGNPRLFWFTERRGRWGDAAQPALEPNDDFAAIDRLRLEERAKPLEVALTAAGCVEAFANEVAWVCRTGHR